MAIFLFTQPSPIWPFRIGKLSRFESFHFPSHYFWRSFWPLTICNRSTVSEVGIILTLSVLIVEQACTLVLMGVNMVVPWLSMYVCVAQWCSSYTNERSGTHFEGCGHQHIEDLPGRWKECQNRWEGRPSNRLICQAVYICTFYAFSTRALGRSSNCGSSF